MIDQSHCFGLGKTTSVASSDEGDAQAVKAGVNAAGSKEGINAPVFVSGQFAGDPPPAFFEALGELVKAVVKRHREKLSWVVLAALCIAQPDCASGQVNVLHRDLALGESAAGVKGDLERGSHPFRLAAQATSQLLNLGVGQFGFNRWRSPRYSKVGNGIGFGIFPSNAFVYELRQEFQFEERGVVTDFSAVNLAGHSPAKIRLSVRVFDLAWVDYSFAAQEEFYGLPSGSIAPSGFGCPILPVGSQVSGDPHLECWIVRDRPESAFLGRSFVGQPLSFARLVLRISPQTSGLLAPDAGIQVAEPQEPERGANVSAKRGHAPVVSETLLIVKNIKRVYCGCAWEEMVSTVLRNSTITPRGIDFPSCEVRSLTQVSHFRLSPVFPTRGNQILEGSL